jgi:protein O-mannosyl-transferase
LFCGSVEDCIVSAGIAGICEVQGVKKKGSSSVVQPRRPTPPAKKDPRARQRRLAVAVCAALVLAVAVVFGRTVGFHFISFDDGHMVFEQRYVRQGLTCEGVVWLSTHRIDADWNPLTALSHALAWQLFGEDAGGHHLVNVVLHAAAAVVLFLVLWRATARLWPSALAAAVFAVHPLRAESVAWVAERKDVLSGLLFMLTLAAYVGYVRRPFSIGRYALVALCLTLGLLSKPMLVTTPLVLLLLDYWPLGRLSDPKGKSDGGTPPLAMGSAAAPTCAKRGLFQAAASWAAPLRRFARLAVEKLPLLAISAAFCASTLWVQREVLEVNRTTALPMRIVNAATSYVAYLKATFWPAGLAVMYPYPKSCPPVWAIASAVVAILAITALVLWRRRQSPYLTVGWFWYLGMLVPVIGVLQVGAQARADRYTYLPQIGIVIAVVWALADLWPARWDRRLQAAVAALTLAVLTAWGCHQTSFWSDNERLWRRSLECSAANYIAHVNLGHALAVRGDSVEQALDEYRSALALEPDAIPTRNSIAVLLERLGRYDEAIAEYRGSVRMAAQSADAHRRLADALAAQNRMDEAVAEYRAAMRLDPKDISIRAAFAAALAGHGRVDEGLAEFRKIKEIEPDNVEIRWRLACALENLGRLEEAARENREAIAIDRDCPDAYNNLGRTLADLGRLDEAVACYRKAIEIRPNYMEPRYNLGNVLAGLGRFDEAIAEYQEALRTKPLDAEVRTNLGNALMASGRGDEAIAQFREALAIRRNCAEAMASMAQALVRSGRYAEAVAAAQEALEQAVRQNKPILAEAMRNLLRVCHGR